jgi:hypothetical protein
MNWMIHYGKSTVNWDLLLLRAEHIVQDTQDVLSNLFCCGMKTNCSTEDSSENANRNERRGIEWDSGKWKGAEEL